MVGVVGGGATPRRPTQGINLSTQSSSILQRITTSLNSRMTTAREGGGGSGGGGGGGAGAGAGAGAGGGGVRLL
jgi:hypothetical protein